MRLLSLDAAVRLKKYPQDKVKVVSDIVQEQATTLAAKEKMYSNKVLQYYNIVHLPIVADILDQDMSGSVATSYALEKLREYLDKL